MYITLFRPVSRFCEQEIHRRKIHGKVTKREKNSVCEHFSVYMTIGFVGALLCQTFSSWLIRWVEVDLSRH